MHLFQHDIFIKLNNYHATLTRSLPNFIFIHTPKPTRLEGISTRLTWSPKTLSLQKTLVCQNKDDNQELPTHTNQTKALTTKLNINYQNSPPPSFRFVYSYTTATIKYSKQLGMSSLKNGSHAQVLLVISINFLKRILYSPPTVRGRLIKHNRGKSFYKMVLH